MHTPGAEPVHAGDGQPGVGAAAKQVAEHASALAKLELELAGLELKQKAGALGLGAGLAAGAALLALYGLGFLFATVAIALAGPLPSWLAALLVALGLFLVAAVLALLARGRFARGTPPVPQEAIREAKLTTETLKSDGHG
jgi:uncharacterized membrane protein YqjE